MSARICRLLSEYGRNLLESGDLFFEHGSHRFHGFFWETIHVFQLHLDFSFAHIKVVFLMFIREIRAIRVQLFALMGMTVSCQVSVRAEESSMFVPIWPEDHPANHQEEIEHKETPGWMTRVQNAPAMKSYLPEKDNANGTAVLILPGGGYGGVSLENEGYPVAEWFQQRGVAAFVLRYRCGGGQNQQPAPLDDAQRAMRLIASQAEQHGYRADRIGVIGFSAGGHLASCVSTMADEGDPEATDPIKKLPAKAAFAVLVYPVISMEFQTAHAGSRRNLLGEDPSDELVQRYTTWKQVDKSTPPTLLIHSSDDKAVTTEHPILYYQQLVKHKVPAEMHIFARGGHGYGLKPGERSFRKWPELMERWLKERALLNEPSPE